MKHLIIIGAGGMARKVFWLAQASIGYGVDFDIKGFLDGSIRLIPEEYEKLQLSVLGNVYDYDIQPGDVFTCAVGSPNGRQKLVKPILAKGGEFLSLIHNTAIVIPSARLGRGIIVCEFSQIDDNASIGDFVMLNTSTLVGHDAQLDDYASTMCHVDIAGFACLGKGAYVGDGACILPHCGVGDWGIVGAGAVVNRDIPPKQTAIGVPAKVLSVKK